ncbi:lytic transglycosylase domain-containing protein [Qipengyuania marisflavi]|uniref:Lytic transglycosylase domain-containing protein n=1 Tax=Qipengyuania marisflavi TaxID=2486356 RepID=A0A5S3P9J9_9SPHN|nr:lytic transglycosylase domain-containing protein [Qipengyuania marisflavi]TMM50174.1 lytic transglycosylase domain-containing protein [Qipengyuania marisflavi]
MSSMDLKTAVSFALLAGTALATPSIAAAQDGASWDRARGNLVANQSGQIAGAISRWEYLIGRDNLSFAEYAGFITTYPGFPQEDKMQRRAEAALDRDAVTPQALVSFFERNPPITNGAKARYALALATMQRPNAFDVARDAWRGGSMSGPAEAYIQGLFGARLTPADHDARMDALLWQSETEAAARQIVNVSPAMRQLAMARLALVQGGSPQQSGLSVPGDARSDAGYVYNLARYYRSSGQLAQAVNALANRPGFTAPAFDPEDFIGEALRIAKGAGADPASRIAANVDDLFAPGADVSKMAYRLRDDYTSLMWLGGTKALWQLGDGNRAAPLFYRYGAAAQTPQTRSKGFYWAGLAARRSGNAADAARYFEMAASYPDRFYGQLAHKELGRALPQIGGGAPALPSAELRAEFERKPVVAAVREVARGAPWRTGIQFYRALAQSADTPEEHALVAELARQVGRRDLAVNVAEAAGADGLDGFVVQGFPTMPVPSGADWTMVHAITRQESQFAENAISHAGATGLMQLMPGTAREQAGKLGISYMSANLIDSPSYNIQLGNGYFARMMSYYGGSYPLAVAAYNAGPGNVNKWIRANGDPRQGNIDWLRWIEEIPIYETKNYVQRVLENAAVYEQLNPSQVRYGKPRTVSDFLR